MVGPMVPSAYLDQQIDEDTVYGSNLWQADNTHCICWLDTKPPKSVVYVSFGSMAGLAGKQVEEIAWGLKSSEQNFLWVVREPENQKLPVEFMNSTGEKGLIVTWCDQLEVLAHPAVGWFVTHCGWNSTLEGLSLGVPMVCLPQRVDQPENAKYVEDMWRVGVEAKKGEDGIVTREELKRCIDEVLAGERNEEIRNKASTWRELAKRAVSKGGSSDKNIEEFAQVLLRSERKKMCG